MELFPSQEAEAAPGEAGIGNAFLSLSLFSNHRFYSASVGCLVLGREVLMRDWGVAICENKGSTTFWVAWFRSQVTENTVTCHLIVDDL